MFASVISAPNGTTAQAASAGPSATTGAIRKRKVLAPFGTTISFDISFSASAIG